MSDSQERLTQAPADDQEVICLCALCRQWLTRADDIMGHDVYKLGELSYTELAHRKCVETHPDAAHYSWE